MPVTSDLWADVLHARPEVERYRMITIKKPDILSKPAWIRIFYLEVLKLYVSPPLMNVLWKVPGER